MNKLVSEYLHIKKYYKKLFDYDGRATSCEEEGFGVRGETVN